MRVRHWSKETGSSADYDAVDAREILERAPDFYTDVDPNPAAAAGIPTNVAAMDEFRREPVGEETPESERVGSILRNATGTPRPADGVVAADDHFVRPRPAVTGERRR